MLRDIRGLHCSDEFRLLNFEEFKINDLAGRKLNCSDHFHRCNFAPSNGARALNLATGSLSKSCRQSAEAMVYRRALRGALWLPLQSKLWRELRAPSPDGHSEPLSRVVQLRGASLLHHDGEQRRNDVLVLSCGVRQPSSTFCVSSYHCVSIYDDT